MSTHNSVKTITQLAGTGATNAIYKLAKASTSAAKTSDLVAAITDTVKGVFAENVSSVGDELPVAMLQGVLEIEAGATVTVGQLAVPDATGRVTGVADIDSIPVDAMAIGIFETGGDVGEVVEVWAQPMVGNTSA